MSPSRLVVLGASGDLTGRYLLPALAELEEAGELPDDLEVVGVSQERWDDERFARHAHQRLERHGDPARARAHRALAARLRHVAGDATDPEVLARAVDGASAPVVAYLALPPSVFAGAVEALGQAGLPEGSRVVVEKPFGTDLASARALNELLDRRLPDASVTRVDHFLGEQTIQNIVGLRFANRLFEPLWCASHVEAVEITWDETIALEGRAGYYDGTGALLDMVQSHLLQVLALVAMERPADLGGVGLRQAKADALGAVRRLSPDEVDAHTTRARYAAGAADGRPVPGYVDEEGVDPALGTETFAAVTLFVDNPRWQGVPFHLRTGKALAADRRDVRIRLRPTDPLPFGQRHEPGPNVITLAMDPDLLAADLALNGAGAPFDLEPARWELALAPQERSPYARLLLAALEGGDALSVGADEVERSWRIIEPIVEAWEQGRSPLAEHPAGSDGPARG